MKLVFEADSWDEILSQVAVYANNHCPNVVSGTIHVPQAEASEEQTQPEDTPEPAAESDTITDDDMIAAIRAHVKKHGKDSGLAILSEYGAERASKVKQEDRAAALAKLNG